jgi:hypothetical protein
MNDKPNELDPQPNVSSNPTDRLPLKTKGKILEICDNPEIAEKRRVRHLEVMRQNTFNLKHGRFSKLLPKYLTDYLDFIDNMGFDQRSDIWQATTKLVRSNLKRIAILEYQELSTSETDKNLSFLIKDTFVMLHTIQQTFNSEVAVQKEDNKLDLTGLSPEQLNALDNFVKGLSELMRPDNYSEIEPVLAS